MTGDSGNKQQAITDWFDAVYKRKGERYLRPLRAYYVFPELLGAGAGETILDIACGLGRLLEAAREYELVMTGIDISGIAAAHAQRIVPEASIAVGNAESLPYANGSFDHVTCLGSLERVLDRKAALAEMLRVGKPSARYCLLVRNANTLSWKTRSLTVPDARNIGNAGADTLAGWQQLFTDSGFDIRSVVPDQYPLQKRARRRSLYLRPVDYRKPLSGSLENANEFIFVMEKRQ